MIVAMWDAVQENNVETARCIYNRISYLMERETEYFLSIIQEHSEDGIIFGILERIRGIFEIEEEYMICHRIQLIEKYLQENWEEIMNTDYSYFAV